MLCEGSPLLFYTWWGPVTSSGTSHRGCGLSRCSDGGPAAVANSFSPLKTRPVASPWQSSWPGSPTLSWPPHSGSALDELYSSPTL